MYRRWEDGWEKQRCMGKEIEIASAVCMNFDGRSQGGAREHKELPSMADRIRVTGENKKISISGFALGMRYMSRRRQEKKTDWTKRGRGVQWKGLKSRGVVGLSDHSS